MLSDTNLRVMEKVSILVLLVFNIALPTLDTFTDINLVLKLYWGAQGCDTDYRNDRKVPVYSSHPKMATAMLIPILLNYIVCFITFLRKEKNKKFTFIFALLIIYPQFGKNNHF